MKLNDSNRGIVLICDQDRNFIGTVTDTDIRSGLARLRWISGFESCMLTSGSFTRRILRSQML